VVAIQAVLIATLALLGAQPGKMVVKREDVVSRANMCRADGVVSGSSGGCMGGVSAG